MADGDTGAARAIVSGGYKRAGNKPLVKKSSAEALSCTGNTSVSYVPAVVLFVGPHVNPSWVGMFYGNNGISISLLLYSIDLDVVVITLRNSLW